MGRAAAASFVNGMKINKQRKRWGFTLIEVLLTMVIISVGLFGLMVLYHNSARDVMEGDINLMAVYLARERMEKLVDDKVFHGYAYVVNDNYDTSADVTVGNHLFTRSFNIYEVTRDDLVTPEAATGYKRIDMTVSWGGGGGQNITISTLLADY